MRLTPITDSLRFEGLLPEGYNLENEDLSMRLARAAGIDVPLHRIGF